LAENEFPKLAKRRSICQH